MELSILMNMYNCNDWERLEHSEGQQITGIVPEPSNCLVKFRSDGTDHFAQVSLLYSAGTSRTISIAQGPRDSPQYSSWVEPGARVEDAIDLTWQAWPIP